MCVVLQITCCFYLFGDEDLAFFLTDPDCDSLLFLCPLYIKKKKKRKEGLSKSWVFVFLQGVGI